MLSVYLYACAALLLTATHAQDAYLDAARSSCLRSSSLMDCARYKAANLVHRIASTRRSFDMGPLRLVSIPGGNSTDEGPWSPSPLSRAAADSPKDPELLKMFKYGLRQVERFLHSHGVSLPLSSLGGGGAHLVYDDGTDTNTITDVRGRGLQSKKKLALLFPLLVLLKFGILKAILLPILLAVLFLKKVVVLAIMALPSVLSLIKACKVVTPYHGGYHSPVYQPVVGVTGSDYSYSPEITSYGYGGGQGYDSYSKDWSANQRRTRWGKATFQPEPLNKPSSTEQQITEQT